jgi:hypothetical protein
MHTVVAFSIISYTLYWSVFEFACSSVISRPASCRADLHGQTKELTYAKMYSLVVICRYYPAFWVFKRAWCWFIDI